MQVSNTLKQISNYLVDQSLDEPRQVQELKIELKSTRTAVRAMRTIISMMQQGYDLGSLYGDVLKIIDTSNYELKVLCNYYLKNTSVDRPACQLMCTQTFMKDFNEINHKIQKLAVNDAVLLCDNVLIKNYIDDIKRMSCHEDSGIRAATCRCIAKFYLKDRTLFHKAGLIAQLNNLLKDKEINVQISALTAAATLEENESLFETADILRMAKKFNDKGRTTALRAALNVLKYKRLSESTRDFYLSLLNTSDICIFFLAASKLLESGMFTNQVYDACLFYMGSRPEQLYNLLMFIYTLIDQVDIDFNDYLILKSDPDFIRELKIQIIFKAISRNNSNKSTNGLDPLLAQDHLNSIVLDKQGVIDMISKELNRSNPDIKLAQSIISTAITFGVFIENAFKSFTTERVLEHALFLSPKDVSVEWKESISDFLGRIKEVEDPKIFISLAQRYSIKIPRAIFNLEREENGKALLQFYLEARDKRIITNKQCLNYLKNLQKKFTSLGIFKIVLSNLESIHSEDIEETVVHKETMQRRVGFEMQRGFESQEQVASDPIKNGLIGDVPQKACNTITELERSRSNNRSNETSCLFSELQDKREEMPDCKPLEHSSLGASSSSAPSERGIEEPKNSTMKNNSDLLNKSESTSNCSLPSEAQSLPKIEPDPIQQITHKESISINKIVKQCESTTSEHIEAKTAVHENSKPFLETLVSSKTEFPIYLNTDKIKGTIKIDGNSMVLVVDILEKPQPMECQVGNFKSKNMIRSEGKYTVAFVPKNGGNFSVLIGDEKFEGNFQ